MTSIEGYRDPEGVVVIIVCSFFTLFLVIEGRDDGFDGQEQCPAFLGMLDELRTAHVKSLGCFVFGMNQHRPNADTLRCQCDPAQCVRKQIRP